MRCPNYDPSPGDNHWMEAGLRAGAWDGQNFDDPATGGAWAVFKKFEHLMTGGTPHDNGNVWTWYSTALPVNSGPGGVLSIGFKQGALYDFDGGTYQPPGSPGFDVGYDGLTVSDQPLTTPPPRPPPPPPAPPGGGSVGTGDNPNGNDTLNDRCGCGVVGYPGTPLPVLLAVGLALACFSRRRQ